MGRGAFNGLRDFFGMPLYQKAVELGYSQDNILILQGRLNELRDQYPDIYHNLMTCDHNRDRRTPEEYAKDLVASWLFEDYLAYCLRNDDFSVRLSGTDRERHLLANNEIGADSDLIISRNGLEAKVEIATDFSNYWERFNRIDFRDDKYNELVESESILLGVSILNRKFFLLDFRNGNIRSIYHRSYPPFGYKLARTVDLAQCNVIFYDFNNANMIREILRIL